MKKDSLIDSLIFQDTLALAAQVTGDEYRLGQEERKKFLTPDKLVGTKIADIERRKREIPERNGAVYNIFKASGIEENGIAAIFLNQAGVFSLKMANSPFSWDHFRDKFYFVRGLKSELQEGSPKSALLAAQLGLEAVKFNLSRLPAEKPLIPESEGRGGLMQVWIERARRQMHYELFEDLNPDYIEEIKPQVDQLFNQAGPEFRARGALVTLSFKDITNPRPFDYCFNRHGELGALLILSEEVQSRFLRMMGSRLNLKISFADQARLMNSSMLGLQSLQQVRRDARLFYKACGLDRRRDLFACYKNSTIPDEIERAAK